MPRPCTSYSLSAALSLVMAFLWLATLAAFGPSPAWSSGSDRDPEPVISAIEIEILEATGPTERLASFARDMISLREGQLFSGGELQHSLELLKSSGLFQSINVPDPDWSREEITLTFRLTPFRRIKDIKIYGAFPLLQREVLNAMTIFTGDAYVASRLKKQEALIASVFMDEGYPGPRIEVTSEKDPEDGQYVITVNVDKGDFLRIRRVALHGNTAFTGTRLKLRLETWKTALFWGEIPRFVQKKLDEDIDNLTRFYRNAGYADVEVNASISRITGTNEVELDFLIDEGVKYKIRFKGNKEFWNYTLKKDLALSRRGNPNDLGLKRSIRNIRNRYIKAGYLDVRVRMSEAGADDSSRNVRNILFTIEEGPRYIVDSLVIQGNTVFDDERINRQMLTGLPEGLSDGEFVPETLTEDISAIHSLYVRDGYLNISVTEAVTHRESEKKGKKLTDITLLVEEGVQTMVADIAFRGLTCLSDAEVQAALALKEGEPFREYMVESDENTLSELVSEKGFPHVTIKGNIQVVSKSDGSEQATVIYKVDEGPFATTGEVFYTGNFRTRERIFEREVELTPDTPFSLIQTLETQRNIRNIDALDSASFKVIGLREKADRVNLLVEVEEKKPYYLEFGAGYDTRRERYAHARMGDHNLLGLNKDGWVASELSDIGYRHELGITEPRFLGTRTSSTLSMFAEDLHEFNQTFGTTTYGTSLAFNRRFLDDFNATLTTRYEHRDQYYTGSDPMEQEEEDQYQPRSIVVTTPSLTYNTTDSFVQPREGMAAFGSLDISRGIENKLDNFLKHRYEVRYYYTPADRLTLALRGRYHYINPYGDNHTIAEDQLLFLGGVSDIRGFAENMFLFDADGNPVGGRTSILGSLEARYDLGLNFELTAFYDTGTIRDLADPDVNEEVRSSAGIGLRYITPIGPIGFLYGWKLDKKPDESAGNLHFSIGYTF